LISAQSLEAASLDLFEDKVIRLLEQSFDLVEDFLEHLKVLSHHGQEICLAHSIESRRIECVLLNNLMEEPKRVFSLREAFLADQAFEGGVSEGVQLFFKGRAPGDTVLLLLLNVLAWHVSGVVQKSHVPLHYALAEITSCHAIVTIDLFLSKAVDTEGLPGGEVEKFFDLVVFLAHSDLLGRA